VEAAARGRTRQLIPPLGAPAFDRFVGVDWSGATGRNYSGIAVADCHTGTEPPTLVEPPGRRWRRTDFADWMGAQAGQGERLLVGIDCAFTLPAAMATQVLGTDYSAAALWAHIDATCVVAEDFFGGGFAEAHRSHFWHSGPRPAGFAELHRATEHACKAAGLGFPESPLKLVGARQVGKGGLAGMRVLHALKMRLGETFAVWPFDPVERADIVCIELYPRLFMKMAGHGNGKVRTVEDLNACLEKLGSETSTLPLSPLQKAPRPSGEREGPGAKQREGEGAASKASLLAGTDLTATPPHPTLRVTLSPQGRGYLPPDPPESLSDHETDALVAAAGLRFIAGDPAVWLPAGMDSLALRAEGWIFGVI
jgi:hypothetical protein